MIFLEDFNTSVYLLLFLINSLLDSNKVDSTNFINSLLALNTVPFVGIFPLNSIDSDFNQLTSLTWSKESSKK